ncbi:glycine-rich domain-containing protein [Sphingomonas sp. NCPPB 2930]
MANNNPCKGLADVLAYENQRLVNMFSSKRKIDIEESRLLFGELKKWLWFLASRPSDSPPFPVFPEQGIIDEIWHEFILSTIDYHEFCNSHFGRYIHHVPTPDGVTAGQEKFGVETALYFTNNLEFKAKKNKLLADSMLEIANVLGLDTVRLWYEKLPNKYYFPEQREKILGVLPGINNNDS